MGIINPRNISKAASPGLIKIKALDFYERVHKAIRAYLYSGGCTVLIPVRIGVHGNEENV